MTPSLRRKATSLPKCGVPSMLRDAVASSSRTWASSEKLCEGADLSFGEDGWVHTHECRNGDGSPIAQPTLLPDCSGDAFQPCAGVMGGPISSHSVVSALRIFLQVSALQVLDR